jgi:hypothetical protein
MYRMKKVVDSVLPCGMPCVIICLDEVAYSVCVVWILFLKYVEMNVIVSWSKLKLYLSLCRSFSCETVSYALERSRYMASVGCLVSMCFWSLSMIVWSAMDVVELGRNAYCVLDMRLC